MSDAEVAQANKDKLARQRAILEVEETYYKKFTKVISERQYNVLMQIDKKKHGMHHMKRNHIQRPDSSTHRFQPLPRPMKPRAELKASDAV